MNDESCLSSWFEVRNMSQVLSDEEIREIKEKFTQLDTDNSGTIDVSELKLALDSVGWKLAQYQVRELVEKNDVNNDGTLDQNEFINLCMSLRASEFSSKFSSFVAPPENVDLILGSNASAEGTAHTISHEEQRAFSNWINTHLGEDKDLKRLLPIHPEGHNLYEKVHDGVLLCKLVNSACPGTIDERVINKTNLKVFRRRENLTLAINSAESIGCSMVNIDAADLEQGKKHLVLAFLWQIIRIGLFHQITLQDHPELINLLLPGEKIEDMLKLSPETLLSRWINHHIKEAGLKRKFVNFGSDLRDSEIYTHLLNQISPKDAGVNLSAMQEKDLYERAEKMLQESEKINCRSFLTSKEVVHGNYNLNVAFVANLFNNYPGLNKPEEKVEVFQELETLQTETREEKTYKNWMNSLGVDPRVNYLYGDLTNGLVIFQIYEIIQANIVNWKKVVKKFNKLRAHFEKIQNCNYAVDLGKMLKFSLVGIAGTDISEGNKTLTLALVWQMMRAYTLTVLSQATKGEKGIDGVEKEILKWVNEKLKSSPSKAQINSFQDPTIRDGIVILDIIDAMVANSVDRSVVRKGASDADFLANAKYAISLARKIGARVYALPEDIVEVKAKMVMTVFACLMAQDYNRFSKEEIHEIEKDVMPDVSVDGVMEEQEVEPSQVRDAESGDEEKVMANEDGKGSVSPTEDSGHGGTITSDEPSEADACSSIADETAELDE